MPYHTDPIQFRLLSVNQAESLVKQSVFAELKGAELSLADRLTDQLADVLTAQPSAELDVTPEVLETRKLDVNARVRGTTFINQYVVVAPLGFGTYGKVKLCLNLWDDQLYAVKLVSKLRAKKRHFGKVKRANLDNNDDWVNEVEVMKKLHHPNLVKLYEVIDDPDADKMLLVMEFVEGGALQSQGELEGGCTPLPENAARKYFRDIVRGLDVLHSNLIIHGDLKPENLLLSADGNVKIADFGSSQLMSSGDYIIRTIGTPAFLPPEVCAGKRYHGRIADLWALGICLYCFVFGTLPFKASNLGDLYDLIQHAELRFPEGSTVSAAARDLISRLLDKDPATRCTLESAAQHPWTTNSGHLGPVAQQEDPADLLLAMASVDDDASNDPVKAEEDTAEATGPMTQPPISLVLVSQMQKYLDKRRYSAGDWLVKQGDCMDQVFWIRDGVVEMIHHSGTPGGQGYDDSDLEEDDSDNSEGGQTVSTISHGRSARSQRWTSRVADSAEGKVVTIRRSGEFLGAWADLHGDEGCPDDAFWDVSIRAKVDSIVWSLSKQQAQNAMRTKPHIQLDLRAAIARAQAEALRSTILERLSVNRKRVHGFNKMLKKRVASSHGFATKPTRSPSSQSGALQSVPSSLQPIPFSSGISLPIPVPGNNPATHSLPTPAHSNSLPLAISLPTPGRNKSMPPLPPSKTKLLAEQFSGATLSPRQQSSEIQAGTGSSTQQTGPLAHALSGVSFMTGDWGNNSSSASLVSLVETPSSTPSASFAASLHTDTAQEVHEEAFVSFTSDGVGKEPLVQFRQEFGGAT